MNKIQRICVYCGSGPGTDPAFMIAAEAFGAAMAAAGIGLVYGGGTVGLMGAVARAARAHGGKVIGIIPEFLMTRERSRAGAEASGLDTLVVTTNMHERKQKMFDAADAFVALPGGVGTLEEVVEQMTWGQLGQHNKPILLANINGFWDPLRALLDHMRRLQFIRPGLSFDVHVADTVPQIIPTLEAALARAAEDEMRMGVTPVSKM